MLEKKKIMWLLWLIGSVAMVCWFAVPLVKKEGQGMYLIGGTTHGHHQIEMQCAACHTSPFGGGEVLQEACVDCHGDELKVANDSHPKSKFTDPRNADRIDILDARYCVTCHREHKKEITGEMGLTLPKDYCFGCHENVAEKRETHKGLAFDSCASSGCHNYHDNRALYEDFLLKHAVGDVLKDKAERLRLNGLENFLANRDAPQQVSALMDAPEEYNNDPAVEEWQLSSHPSAGVACRSCHQDGSTGDWHEKPNAMICGTCHQSQMSGFLAGKHGMRLKAGLSAMTPAMARIAMKDSASHLALSCTSCHSPHDVNQQSAGFEACVGCHDSSHVNNFANSPHAGLMEQARRGEIPDTQSVDCATCHLPREIIEEAGEKIVRVNHNQNDNLRPNQKMIRTVCLDCHSLAFAIDSLADPALIQSNFSGLPTSHVRSIDMAVERDEKANQREKVF
ncbi:MAG: cytochrome c3 family protein [Pseudomonadales bacterium]|nr:cytochrome c3 family protein [Pseudomonadales bacterium]